jgi:hypothetical protein
LASNCIICNFLEFLDAFELHSLNLNLCSKQYNSKFVLHLIVAPQLSSGWGHNYSPKTRQAGQANEQSMYPPMSMCAALKRQTKIKFQREKNEGNHNGVIFL